MSPIAFLLQKKSPASQDHSENNFAQTSLLTPVPAWSSSKVAEKLGCEPTALTFMGRELARLGDQK